MKGIQYIEGHFKAEGLRFALVASRFNDFIVSKLVDGAIDCLIRHGGSSDNMTVVRVPGSFEIPQATRVLANSGKYHGIICLGAVIRGATSHYDVVVNEVSKGIAQIALQTDTAIGFGVLTTDTLEQAIERAGSKAGNKGVEAALAALEMAQVLALLK